MYMRMFDEAGFGFQYDTVPIYDGAAFPDPATLEGIVITGSSAGVYDDHAWLDPLRAFIRGAYAADTPMLGICFGHQIMADALGGDVRKSEKGWGLGRHTYSVKRRPDFLATE
jgi:GMP synthase-like glutamine amidotransferase